MFFLLDLLKNLCRLTLTIGDIIVKFFEKNKITKQANATFVFNILKLAILSTAFIFVLSVNKYAQAEFNHQKSVGILKSESEHHNSFISSHISGHHGLASIYDNKYNGRKMADGTRYSSLSDNAASKNLPLGTVARVHNLDTGKSSVVHIKDYCPNAPKAIIDLSPLTASKIGLNLHQGLAHVVVQTIEFPKHKNKLTKHFRTTRL